MIATEELRQTRQAPPVVNDFTFMAATINGSGSQSANCSGVKGRRQTRFT